MNWWSRMSVAVLVGTVILAGCHAPEQKQAGNVISVGLGAWMLMEFPMLTEVASDFDAHHPGLAIDYAKFGDEPPKYIMQFRRKYCDNDIILGTSDGLDMYSAVRIGALADLSDYVSDKAWELLLPPAQTEAARYGGGKVCVPLFGEVMALNYNKALLQEAGIDHPATTWEELETQAAVLKAKLPEKVPVAVRLYEYADIYWMIPTVLSMAGTTEGADGWPMTDGPAVEQSLTMLRRWVENGYCNGVDVRPADAFRAGDAVYFISWASHGSWARKTLGNDTVGVAPLPGERAYVSFHFGTVPVFGAHVADAADFLETEMLSDTMQQGIFAAGKMGVRTADYEEGKVPAWMLPLRSAMEHGYTGPSVKRNIRELNLRIHEAVQAVAADTLSPKDAMRQMTEARAAIEAKLEADSGQ